MEDLFTEKSFSNNRTLRKKCSNFKKRKKTVFKNSTKQWYNEGVAFQYLRKSYFN